MGRERESRPSSQQNISGAERRESRRIAPGKVTRTERLAPTRGAPVQRVAAAAGADTSRPEVKTAWEWTNDPWMDAAHRGTAPPELRGGAAVQAKGSEGGDHIHGRDHGASQATATQESPASATFARAASGAGGSVPFQQEMESFFGTDFSSVRAHLGKKDEMNAISAHAATMGEDIAFETSNPPPELVAHELTHVVQHRKQGGAAGLQAKAAGVSQESDASEHEANAIASRYRAYRSGGIGDRLPSPVQARASGLALGQRGAAADIHERAPAGRVHRCGCTPRVNSSGDVSDVSGLPEGPIRTAATQLAASDQEVDRNTVQRLVDGDVIAGYIDDLQQPPNVDDAVRGYGRDPSAWTLYYQPGSTTQLMWVQKNAIGFRIVGSNQIFGWRAVSADRWKTLLVHETNHARNVDPHTPVENYKSEFRAYWVAEFRHVADLDDRARQIKEHVLRDYPAIKAAYDADPAVKSEIDGHTRPDGNLTNA